MTRSPRALILLGQVSLAPSSQSYEVMNIMLTCRHTFPDQTSTRRRPLLRLAALTAASLVLAGLTPLAASAAGADQWTGLADGTSWGQAGNWSAGVPQSGDSVTIAPTAQQAGPDVTGMPSGVQLADLTVTDSSLSGGSVTVSGSFSWTVSSGQKTIGSAITVDGTATISGAGEKVSQGSLTFNGATDVSGTGLLLTEFVGKAISSSATFTIEPGADIQSDACCVSLDQFVNTGTLKVPASTSGTATLSGMELVDQGTISVGAGSLLHVTVGPVDLSPSVGIGGGGTVSFDQGAQVILATGVSIGSGTTLGLAGNASITGTGSFTGSGRFSWTGGTIGGNLDVASTVPVTISGTTAKGLIGPTSTHVKLTFHGAVTLAAPAQVNVLDGDISSSGTFTVQPGAAISAESCCVSPNKFVSSGTLKVPASTAGTATLSGMDLLDQGAVSVGTGSMLHVIIGPAAFSPSVGISGGGTVTFDQGARATLASGVVIGTGTTLGLAGNASLVGTGSFTGSGKFSWTGGAVEGNLTVAKTVSTSISGTAVKGLAALTSTAITLVLDGPTTLSGTGPIMMSGPVSLKNLGTFTMRAGTTIEAQSCCLSPDHFINSGTLVVAASPSTATFSALAFATSGKVKISSGTLVVNTLSYHQSGGSTTLAGGALSAQLPIQIAGGTLTGHGTITGSVVNGGTVQPSSTAGLLTISGSYTQTTSGTLASVITGTTPGTKYGQLVVGGAATLAGTLKLTTAQGFTPTRTESFLVLKYLSRTGKFGTLSGSPAYAVTYQATDVKVVFS